MKNLIFVFGIIIPILCNSQDDIGKLYIETSTTLFGSGNHNAFIGKTGFSLQEFKMQSYSLAPRVGYYLTNLVAVGAELQFYNEKNRYGGNISSDIYKNFLCGVFLRQYFLNKKTNPFIEISTGIGTSKYLEELKYSIYGEYLYNLSYISGAIGCSFTLNPRLKLDISATIQNTIEKQNDSGSNYYVDRFSTIDSELIMSISYYLNRRKSNINNKK